jgi:hypothetical protein
MSTPTPVSDFPVDTNDLQVTFDDVSAAAARLNGVANETPVMTSRTVDARTGATAFFKCENFQRVGAFKFRGGYNALAQFSEEQKERGVIAYSSGNHAQAIALAGRLLDIPATIVMPENAPEAKLNATRGYGAEIVPYDPETTVREELAAEIAEERDLTLIPSFDHPDVVAGQGTAGLELLQDVSSLDTLLVCCGGGGLLSGCALAAVGRDRHAPRGDPSGHDCGRGPHAAPRQRHVPPRARIRRRARDRRQRGPGEGGRLVRESVIRVYFNAENEPHWRVPLRFGTLKASLFTGSFPLPRCRSPRHDLHEPAPRR